MSLKSSPKYFSQFVIFTILLVFVIGLSWSVNVRAQTEILDQIVATVDRLAITESEVQRRIKFLRLEANQTGSPPVDEALRRRAIEEEISFELTLRQLGRYGTEVTLADIDDRITALSEQNGMTVEEFVDQFKAFNMNQTDVRILALQTIADEQLTQRVLIPRANIRESEIDRYLRLNDSIFDQNSPEFNLDVIVVRANEVSSSAHRQELLQIAADIESELNRGRNFEEIAVAVQSVSGIDVGELGWRRSDDIMPELNSAISNRGNKRILGPIQIGGSLVFTRIRDIRTGSGIDLPAVRQFHYAINILQASNVSGLALIEEQMEDIRKRVQEGEDFSALAKVYSHDNDSRRSGGDLGWRSDDNMPLEHLQLLVDLEIGDVSEIQIQRNTVFILQLLGVREASIEERKRSYVRSILRNHKLNNERLKNLDQLRARAEIEYRTQF